MDKKTLARNRAFNDILTISQGSDNILICLPTGYGKTLNAIKLINLYYGRLPVLFLVPRIDLIENARQEFIKHGYSDLLEYVEFACYASMRNYEDKVFSVVVCDEIHNAYSDIRSESLTNIKTIKRIGLSATISDEIRAVLYNVCVWSQYVKTLKEGIEEGVLAEPEIRYVDIELDDKVLEYKVEYGKKSSMVTQRGYYNYLSKNITYWRERYQDTGETFAGNKMKQLGSQRQKFLADCKEPYVQELIKELGEERFICFCGSVAQAKRLGGNVCSSHTSKKGNEELITKFNNKEISYLLAKDMLKEGTNLVDTDYGILIQPGNSEKDFVQMLGRTLRSDKPVFYIFRAKNTVDDRFISNQTKQLS